MSPQAGWILQEEIVPRLKTTIPYSTSLVGCEDVEELVQDATAFAAKMLDSVERRGKQVTPGNIAYYTLQHIRSGRRSTGSSTVDILGTGTQLHGHTRLTSLDETAASDEAGGEIFTFNDVLTNQQEDPSVIAARELDWEGFNSLLSKREKMLVKYLLEGKTCRAVARNCGLSDSTIQTLKRQLAQKILEYMGVDILVTVQQLPHWKNGLAATKELQACRLDRRKS